MERMNIADIFLADDTSILMDKNSLRGFSSHKIERNPIKMNAAIDNSFLIKSVEFLNHSYSGK